MSSSVHWAEATSHFPTNSSKKALEPTTKVGHGKIPAASAGVLSAALRTSTLPLRKVGVGKVGIAMVGVMKEICPSWSGLELDKRHE